MTKKFIKAITVALSISLLAPFASKVNAETTTAPQIIGTSSVTMDMETGEVIYSKNAEEKHALASTTKLLTSLIFAENKSKTDLIPYTETSINLTETSLNNYMPSGLKSGDSMTADDVMKSVLIFSGNDTAIMMAESVAGSVDKFAQMMNERAAQIGAINTKFVNPHGLELDPTSYNYTTAYDLALIAKAAYNNDWVRETMALEKADVTLNGSKISIEQRNKLLGKDGNIGGKTGNEELSGHCFVGFFERDGRHLVSVVLGSEYGADGTNVFNDTKKIADYSYTEPKIVYKNRGEIVSTIDLSYKLFRFFGPEKTISVPVKLTSDVELYSNDFNEKNVKIDYTGDTSNAWKLASNPATNLTLSIKDYETEVTGTVELKTMTLLKDNSVFYLTVAFIAILVIVLIIVIVKLISSRRRRNRRGRYYR